MTQNIVSFPSGFYGLTGYNSADIIRADLVKWDGVKGTSYPFKWATESASFEYYQDAENTVYYTDKGGMDARIWCSGAELNRHCHHLWQIQNR